MARLNVTPARALDTNANPISGGTRTVYLAGTTTIVPTYADAALTTQHPQAIPADSAGFFPEIYVADGSEFRVTDRDAGGATVWNGDFIAPSAVPPGQFSTRSAFVATKNKYEKIGSVVHAGGAAYRYIGTGTAIADLPGWVPEGDVTPAHFGADVTGATDAASAVQAASTYATTNGKTLRFAAGSYRLNSTVTHDLTGYTSESDEKGPRIVGDGAGVTEIIVGHAGAGIRVLGDNAVGAGAHGHAQIAGLKFRGATADVGIGLQVDKLAFMQFDDLFFYQLADGMVGTDMLSSRLYNVRGRFNRRGLTLNARTTFSDPNSITLYGAHFGQNKEYGIRVLGGATFSMFGGSVEKNGLTGATGLEAGIRIESAGIEGAVGCNIEGVYFEGNKGDADVVITPGVNPAIYNVTGCNFNRVSATDYTTRNVFMVTSSGDGRSILRVGGCGFRGFNGYIEDAARPYIQILDAGSCAAFEDGGNLYSDVIAWPTVRGQHVYAACSFDGTLASPIPANARNVASITKNGTGDYTLTFRNPLPVKRGLSVSLNGAAVGWNFGDTTTTIRIRTSAVTNILTDYSSVVVEVSV